MDIKWYYKGAFYIRFTCVGQAFGSDFTIKRMKKGCWKALGWVVLHTQHILQNTQQQNSKLF